MMGVEDKLSKVLRVVYAMPNSHSNRQAKSYRLHRIVEAQVEETPKGSKDL